MDNGVMMGGLTAYTHRPLIHPLKNECINFTQGRAQASEVAD